MVESISTFAATEYAVMKPTKKQMKRAILPVLTVLCASFGARADDDVTLRMVFDGTRDVSITNATTYRYIATSGNHGGALEVSGNASYVTNADVTFLGNSVSGEGYHGGALYNNAFKGVTFNKNVSFNGNSAQAGSGGAVYNVNGVLNLYTTYTDGRETFVDNYARDSGGAVYNSVNGRVNVWGNVKFKGNKAKDGGAYYGGSHSVLSFEGGETVFESNVASSGNGVFRDNRASEYCDPADACSGGRGGAIYNEAGAEVTLAVNGPNKKFQFESNIAGFEGGAIYNGGAFTLTGNAAFEQNKAKEGGAVWVYKDFSVTGNAKFTSNTASSAGGAIYLDNNSATLGSANFIGNTAQTGGGGGVYAAGSTLFTVTGAATFNGNAASLGDGGALFVEDGSAVFSGFASFTNNTAGSADGRNGGLGGAIYNNGGEISFSAGATFEGNKAGDSGGAIYNLANSTVRFSGGTYTFKNNSDSSGLNDIYNDGTLNIGAANKTTILNVSHVAGGGLARIKGNTTLNAAQAGGTINWRNGMSIGGSQAILTINGNIKFNSVNNALFGLQDGGALFNCGELVANGNGEFIGNKAHQHGGAMATIGATGTTVWNGHLTFKQNEATADGGALHTRFSGTTTLTGGADFIKNTSGGYGGGIYNGSTTNLFGGTYTFKDNSDSSGLNDIFNGSDLNVGIAGKTTSLVISFVTGGGTTTFDGDVTVNSIKNNGVKDNTNTVSWDNKIALASGATLDIGKSVLNVGSNNFDASGGTLKLSISDMTADSSDYVGGQFKTAGTATIGKLFVTVDPSLIFSGTTGELLLLDGYTGTFTADQIGISDGYTITYTEDGKFIIGCANGTCGGLPPTPPSPTPEPLAKPENAGFSVIEVSRANVRSVLGALTSRASSGFTAGGFKGRSAGAETQKYGVWV